MTAPTQTTRVFTRHHLLLVGTAILITSIGMGVFLRHVSKLPRREGEANQQTRPTHQPVSEETPALPFVKRDDPSVVVADFGKLLPSPTFPQEALPVTPSTPKTESRSEPMPPSPPPMPPVPKIESKPTPTPATLAAEPLRWKLKKGDRFQQELVVTQKPTFVVQGLSMQSLLQYSVVSTFEVEKGDEKGVVLSQRVEGAKLLAADQLTQGLVLPALAKLPGTKFTIQLGPDMSVQRFTGADTRLLIGGGALPGGFGLQSASLLDVDGWREMAQATFFQPAPSLQPRTQWARPMAHAWGPLGNWIGQTLFVYSGRQGNLHQFTYGHQMKHVAPRGGGGAMPFQIAGAAFEPREAIGSLVFDAEAGRVVSGQERFRVVGRLSIVLLGQPSPVDIEEEQTFQFRILAAPPR